MLKRKLEEKIEVVRLQMEETAKIMGIGHPIVYQLSVELDQLHNEWHRMCGGKRKNIYKIRKNHIHVKECSAIEMYQYVG
ncbi:hypothetical protein J2Z48_000739 [Croceifilum oryzae]|uniref:Spo0E like sporulation regulatory protein n=1 Tax=Croceifilum oryzae TaxID=1553429 RepID=A0AAJ1TGF5_9BACL|nr:aspartyl-phosphate phosphatase Spo0E family protein [Croceifilum oryzae]MDQ0416572.1 hypothetical protein [Croceifilum oryzae]